MLQQYILYIFEKLVSVDIKRSIEFDQSTEQQLYEGMHDLFESIIQANTPESNEKLLNLLKSVCQEKDQPHLIISLFTKVSESMLKRKLAIQLDPFSVNTE